jgi:hypothetical protein
MQISFLHSGEIESIVGLAFTCGHCRFPPELTYAARNRSPVQNSTAAMIAAE